MARWFVAGSPGLLVLLVAPLARSAGAAGAPGPAPTRTLADQLRAEWREVDGVELSHEELVRAVRAADGIREEAEYPGFSDDPIDAFRRLRADLDRFGEVFISGSAEQFRALKQWVDEHPKPSGFAAVAR